MTSRVVYYNSRVVLH